jgi:hypothetical protein
MVSAPEIPLLAGRTQPKVAESVLDEVLSGHVF